MIKRVSDEQSWLSALQAPAFGVSGWFRPRWFYGGVTPYGSFGGSGSSPEFPIAEFAVFYVTGWQDSGNGFNNPCQGNGDDPVPNNDPGTIVGHFIKYIDALNTGGGGTDFCDFTAFGNCVSVLTR